jgi:hypothetical protein
MWSVFEREVNTQPHNILGFLASLRTKILEVMANTVQEVQVKD